MKLLTLAALAALSLSPIAHAIECQEGEVPVKASKNGRAAYCRGKPDGDKSNNLETLRKQERDRERAAEAQRKEQREAEERRLERQRDEERRAERQREADRRAEEKREQAAEARREEQRAQKRREAEERQAEQRRAEKQRAESQRQEPAKNTYLPLPGGTLLDSVPAYTGKEKSNQELVDEYRNNKKSAEKPVVKRERKREDDSAEQTRRAAEERRAQELRAERDRKAFSDAHRGRAPLPSDPLLDPVAPYKGPELSNEELLDQYNGRYERAAKEKAEKEAAEKLAKEQAIADAAKKRAEAKAEREAAKRAEAREAKKLEDKLAADREAAREAIRKAEQEKLAKERKERDAREKQAKKSGVTCRDPYIRPARPVGGCMKWIEAFQNDRAADGCTQGHWRACADGDTENNIGEAEYEGQPAARRDADHDGIVNTIDRNDNRVNVDWYELQRLREREAMIERERLRREEEDRIEYGRALERERERIREHNARIEFQRELDRLNRLNRYRYPERDSTVIVDVVVPRKKITYPYDRPFDTEEYTRPHTPISIPLPEGKQEKSKPSW